MRGPEKILRIEAPLQLIILANYFSSDVSESRRAFPCERKATRTSACRVSLLVSRNINRSNTVENRLKSARTVQCTVVQFQRTRTLRTWASPSASWPESVAAISRGSARASASALEREAGEREEH